MPAVAATTMKIIRYEAAAVTTADDHARGEKKDPKTILRDMIAMMIAQARSLSRAVVFSLVMCRSFHSCVDDDPAVAADIDGQ